MAIKTVIFDLDGTLLNTLADLQAAINVVLVSYGYPQRTLEEIKSFVGNGIKKAIERAVPEPVPFDKINKMTDLFIYYYQEHINELTTPYNGIIPMLDELKQKNYKLGVVSNKYDAAVKKLCNDYFPEYISSAIGESSEIERKPNPNGILKVLEQTNSKASEAIYVGDSDVDVITAQNAGIPCISVLWGFRDKEFLINSGANIFAQTPSDIIKIIEKKLYLS